MPKQFAPAIGTRFYRDSIAKMNDATAAISSHGDVDFMVELGDFKDTSVSEGCTTALSPLCQELTQSYLATIERALTHGFDGPTYHLLGNHDVDVLSQYSVLSREKNAPVDDAAEGSGYYSFNFPQKKPQTLHAEAPAPDGGESSCVVKEQHGDLYWLVYSNGTRSSIAYPTGACLTAALTVADASVYTRLDGGMGPLVAPYLLSPSESGKACATPRCCNPNRTQLRQSQPSESCLSDCLSAC